MDSGARPDPAGLAVPAGPVYPLPGTDARPVYVVPPPAAGMPLPAVDAADTRALFDASRAGVDRAGGTDAGDVQIGRLIGMLRVSHVLAGSLDQQTIVDALLAEATGFLANDTALVGLVDADRRLVPTGSWGIDPGVAARLPLFSIDDGWFARIFESGRPWYSPESTETDRTFSTMLGIGAAVLVPLIDRGQPIGLLVVSWKGGHAVGPEEVVFLDTVASLGAVAIHNASLLEDARRWSEQLGVVQASMARLNRLNSIASIGEAIVEETGRVIDYHNCRVYLIEPPDVIEPIAFRGIVGEYTDIPMSVLRTRLGEGFTGWVALHNEPILAPDANADPRGVLIPGTDAIEESMLLVPMRFDDKAIGVVTLSKLGLNQFDERDLRLMTILADAAATAVESARALEEARRRELQMRSLLEMSSDVAQTLDPLKVADLIASHTALAFEADTVSIGYWHRDTGILQTLAVHPREHVTRFGDDYDVHAYPETLRCLLDQRPEVIRADDSEADEAEIEFLRRRGYAQNVMVPLVAKGESIGLIEIALESTRAFDAESLRFATTMANEAAMALENARLYEQARSLADRDPLTNFFNHRYLHERLGEELLRARRGRRPLSLLMLDLDDFKLVNDTLGHQVGDQVLRWSADLIRSALRESDVPARYGGDEFAVILPDADVDDASRVADRITAAFGAAGFHASERGSVPIGVSIGAAAFPGDARTAGDLIAIADADLYRAKRAGDAGAHPQAQPATARRGEPTTAGAA